MGKWPVGRLVSGKWSVACWVGDGCIGGRCF